MEEEEVDELAGHHHHEERPEPRFESEYRFELLSSAELQLPRHELEVAAAALGFKTTDDEERIRLQRGDQHFLLASVPPLVDREALAQSWNWSAGRQVVPHCRSALRVTDQASAEVPWKERVDSIRAVLRLLLSLTQPEALFAPHSQQYLDPILMREALADEPGDELFGFLNVRLYKVEGSEEGLYAEYDETIMDTLGLSALGLPDLQAHFKHLDPTLVAELLYDTAGYVYDKGPLIETGHRLAGFAPDHQWICQLEQSIVEPHRLVVDLDPGKPYVAGHRE